MFKGIRQNKQPLTTLLVLVTFLLSSVVAEAKPPKFKRGKTSSSSSKRSSSNLSSKTDRDLRACRAMGGKIEQVNRREDVLQDDDEKKVYKECVTLTCTTSNNLGTVEFGSEGAVSAERIEDDDAEGVYVYRSEVCSDAITVDRGSVVDDVSGGGQLGVTVRYNGSTYTCRGIFDAIDCLLDHGVDIDIDGLITESGGINDDGYRIVRIRTGGGGDGSGSADGSIGADIDLDTDGTGGSGFYTYRYNGRDFRCMVGQDINTCLRGYGVSVDGSVDLENCVHCGYRRSYRGGGSGGWAGVISATAELAGAILPPVMHYKGQKAWASAYKGSNRAWANAAATGFQQCQMMQTNYVDLTYQHIQSNELPDRDVMPPECNGYALNGFAGMQGFGSLGVGGFGNPFQANGYSPGFLGAMWGPGGNYMTGLNVTGMGVNPYMGLGMNPYGNAGISGNLNLNSLLGLPPGGVNFGVGATGGFGGPGAYGQFGSPMMCFTAPCPGGAGTMGPGWSTGVNTGMWNNGMYMNNPYFSAVGNGTVPGSGFFGTGGFGIGGYGTGGYGPGGYGPGGYGPGGYGQGSVNGGDWWSVQQGMTQNYQENLAGSQYQNMALQNQFYNSYNDLGYNTGGGAGYGYAPYAPSNMGFSLGFGYNFGMH